MQPNELKAVLAKTHEVALRPVHVEVIVKNPRNPLGQILCPANLVRGVVIRDNEKWIEKRTIARCGDQDYEIQRKNGVLVELDPDDVKGHLTIKGNRVIIGSGTGKMPCPHTQVITRNGKKYIHLITSRRAIFSSWGEYVLDKTKREKQVADEQAKYDDLRETQAALMGVSLEEFKKLYSSNSDKRLCFLAAHSEITEYEQDEHGNDIYRRDDYGWNRRVPKTEVSKIEITLDQAKKILSILTPAQKKKLSK